MKQRVIGRKIDNGWIGGRLDATPDGSIEPPPSAAKRKRVAAVRGFADRTVRHPAHPKVPHAQPPSSEIAGEKNAGNGLLSARSGRSRNTDECCSYAQNEFIVNRADSRPS